MVIIIFVVCLTYQGKFHPCVFILLYATLRVASKIFSCFGRKIIYLIKFIKYLKNIFKITYNIFFEKSLIHDSLIKKVLKNYFN